LTAEPSCKDEARIGQQGTLTRVWARHGTRPRAPRDRRYDWAYLFGAACPQRRVAASLVMPAANAEAMSLHLAAIGSKVAPGSHAALVLDGAGYHIAAALTIPNNVTLIPTTSPSFSCRPMRPNLNPMEMSGNICAATNSPSPYSKTTTTSSIEAARHGASSPMTANVLHPSPHDHGQQSISEAAGIRWQETCR
jgi:hypothetical protein